jgi:hypothetical protein
MNEGLAYKNNKLYKQNTYIKYRKIFRKTWVYMGKQSEGKAN